MTKQYRTREGDVTAVDTKTQLTTLGSETAPGPLLVPAGVSKLVGMHVAAMPNFAATGSATCFIRLEGPGLPGGTETAVAGAYGVTIATGGQAAIPAHYIPLDAPVTSANEILIFAEMAGADIGTFTVGVTLVFS